MSSKPFKVAKVAADKKGVQQVFDEAKPTKPAYPASKCTVMAALSANSVKNSTGELLKVEDEVICKGTFVSSKPFMISKIDQDKKGKPQVWNNKTAYASTKCTLQSRADSAGSENGSSTGSENGSSTVSESSEGAPPPPIGATIEAPPPGTPPPNAQNTIQLKLKSTEKELGGTAFNAAFKRATGINVNAVYQKKPDGTMKVLNAPVSVGGRRRTMKGGAFDSPTASSLAKSKKAPKAPKALKVKAAKPPRPGAKPVNAAKQAQINASKAASKLKKGQKGVPGVSTKTKKVKVNKATAQGAALNANRTRLAASYGTPNNPNNEFVPPPRLNNGNNAFEPLPPAQNYAQLEAAPLSTKTEPVTITVETKGPIDPVEVEKLIEADPYFKLKGANVATVPPPDPTPDTTPPPANIGSTPPPNSTQGMGSNGTQGTGFTSANSSTGNAPFDFRAIDANPGKPIELKGAQKYTQSHAVEPGQIIHGLEDVKTGVKYSEFQIDDDGATRTYRVVGTPEQIIRGSRSVAGKIALEEIMQGPGGYEALLRDLTDREGWIKRDIAFLGDILERYKLSRSTLDRSQQRIIDDLIPQLKGAIANREGEQTSIQKHKIGLQAGVNVAQATAGPAQRGQYGGKRRNSRRNAA